ncbi:hypothetical protein E2562_004937 [Oryza meyeriana var. granulata]|uniref:Uncharacterized protein n=1 Tax=Oryza meyeriana var. granulata TaxID=110450 RepID=A0A6G1C4I6_9ORYZ|nr:hypothetical protein E2562_004937 [Oryza meyeriana var. granulata]
MGLLLIVPVLLIIPNKWDDILLVRLKVNVFLIGGFFCFRFNFIFIDFSHLGQPCTPTEFTTFLNPTGLFN